MDPTDRGDDARPAWAHEDPTLVDLAAPDGRVVLDLAAEWLDEVDPTGPRATFPR